MIETERLLLVPFTVDVLDSLIESDESFMCKYGYKNEGGPYLKPSPEYLAKMKQRLIDFPEEYPLAVDYMIIIKDNKTVIGTVYYKYLPNDEGVSEVGYGMNSNYEGNGYMSEALQAILGFGKNNGVKTVVAETTYQNLKSQNVLKRCGFSVISVQEDRLWYSIRL